ncbi:MAG: indole-3-glycerol phosphate synthase TrpC [Porphyromonadaceae bacterium]|nr:indole-3-glycerol phosphate synthase TrpC [Porphyromonadaceae bacterium]
MKDILEEIVAEKRREIERQKQIVSEEVLCENCTAQRLHTSMRKALTDSPYGIIAEFKRKSPSKGWIKQAGEIRFIPPAYEENGAAALSILTDTPFFGGSLHDIATVRPLTRLPILRKDFIIDEYQLYQAKLVGADAVLLIAAALPLDKCRQLVAKAHELGMEVLLEIHREEEFDYISGDIDMIGINNRNLGTFHTDVENSFRLAGKLPEGAVKVSESGISRPETIKALRAVGFNGFLIGETFMREENPGEALHRFIRTLECS